MRERGRGRKQTQKQTEEVRVHSKYHDYLIHNYDFTTQASGGSPVHHLVT